MKDFVFEQDGKQLALVIARRKSGGGLLGLDFDKVTEHAVKKEVHRIMMLFALGNCLLSVSSGEGEVKNFHAIFFWNQLRWGRITRMIEETRNVDAEFARFTKQNGYVRLRLSGMSGMTEVLESPFHKHNVTGDFTYRHYLEMTKRLVK